MRSSRTRILVADRQPIIRLAVRGLVEEAGFEICAETGTGASTLAAALRTRPDLCLLDPLMPGGAIAAREIARLLPETKIAFLVAPEDDDELLGGLPAGVAGYVRKDADPAGIPELLTALLRDEVRRANPPPSTSAA